MERAISYINIMPDTKSGIELFVNQVLDQVEARQSLNLLVKLTAMEKIIEGIKDGIKEQILQEADLNGEKSFTIDGVRFDKKSKTTYYYNHSTAHEALKSKLKAMEDMMKIGEYVDTETAEVIPAANKSYTEYIAVTLKKT